MKDRFHPHDIMVASGDVVNLETISEKDIDLADILFSITAQPRFAGHLPVSYTVGQHTLAMYVAGAAMGEHTGVLRTLLMHDMHEYLTGDIPSPVKRLLGPEIGELEDRIDTAIFQHFRHLPTPAEVGRCKHYDDLMWQAELHVLRNVKWDRLRDDMYLVLCATVRKISTFDTPKVQRALLASLEHEFSKQEVMQ